MFGYATFAQAPFADLGVSGAVFDVDVTEAGVVIASSELANVVFVATNAEGASTAETVNTINNIFNKSFGNIICKI